ncbi:hypothetical protein [Gordonibacter massiliensis (ex Traore et al. 2017)]|uniref:hypothetical protein n=1 Tax=Gordonibacter massiliensis (ex Traore et al. 2017) TaxID=1841863 RepID=UPI001C8CB92A|nr:hypothetical protein [Gordonibacter massiliensis (ex Traore et al. 2017)]MBX9033253.1 hypothetical protein [Gordonibacter massiliensis (ex Traore et al. 2017)]
MAEERLETAAASEHAIGMDPQGNSSPWGKGRGNRAFRIITLVALPLLWIGFFHSLFTGNEGNMSSYSLVILMFSLLNADVLIKGEKLPNKVLNVLAKANCVLLFLWAVATIVHVLVK